MIHSVDEINEKGEEYKHVIAQGILYLGSPNIHHFPRNCFFCVPGPAVFLVCYTRPSLGGLA